jgi:hypothetical protein
MLGKMEKTGRPEWDAKGGCDHTCVTPRPPPARRLIIISPYLESWLLIRGKRSGINSKSYGLPDEPKELKSIPHLEKNKGFQEFVKDLANKDSEIFLILKWISDYNRIER